MVGQYAALCAAFHTHVFSFAVSCGRKRRRYQQIICPWHLHRLSHKCGNHPATHIPIGAIAAVSARTTTSTAPATIATCPASVTAKYTVTATNAQSWDPVPVRSGVCTGGAYIRIACYIAR